MRWLELIRLKTTIPLSPQRTTSPPTVLSTAEALHSHPPIDIENMELNYPMPDKAEVWHQADHPDTITKALNYNDEAMMETFKGAGQILSNANPEQFLMPLKVITTPDCRSLDLG
jgi:hypothetical protein